MTLTPPLPSDSAVSMLLFGPQALSFSADSLYTLREFLHKEEDCKWMLDGVSELPGHWKSLLFHIPKLHAIPGEKLLHDLDGWLRHGKIEEAPFQLPNILLTPLVVLTQLMQFSRYLTQTRSNAASESETDPYSALAHQHVETMGLCTGLLSASVIASTRDRTTFQQYGAVAVRLAMVVGAVVDAEDASDRLHGLSKSFSVGWSSPDMAKELVRVLDCFPEAYISVLFDENRATLTTAEGTAPLLLQQLKQKGVLAAQVGLRGRFHSQSNHDGAERLRQFCESNPAFQFPDISDLNLPIHLYGGNRETRSDAKLHDVVLRMILLEQADWFKTFSHVLSTRLDHSDSIVISLGPDRGVPPSLLRKLGARLIHASDFDQNTPSLKDSAFEPNAAARWSRSGHGSENDIAVVGMSCQVAGANDVNEFWKIICAGQSQHVEVPAERFGPETQWRDVDPARKWYGNFIKDHDVFDHKFFKKSPREVVSTDPQHRLMLQCAYQAVEQSGYFHQSDVDPKIGCYLGACAADYEQNVAGYAPNAFTATGNLKSFIAGKISHYFGWTGPGMTIDSACSASAVAIHQACKSIIGGECSGALAGGVGLMGNITWFQNLAGASFLSPTGQCKPWDDKADGYCRGEAVAVVFLKKMSDAIADGNQILGCIASTAVYQNENFTPVFVPNSPSLSYLFKDVLHRANIEPRQISVVEAHGTGTPVGDPAEYESVLQALGGSARDEPLSLGSVKGLIGHTEGASGVVSLIKPILMIQNGFIPPQASFQTMSHHIQTRASDNMEIVTKLKPWEKDFKAALINNYGASGSNASMIVTQPSHGFHPNSGQTAIHAAGIRHPLWLCGLDDRAIREYAIKTRSMLREHGTAPSTSKTHLTIANLAFNICRQSNRRLGRGLMLSCNSVDDLENKLAAFINGDSSAVASSSLKASPLPVIMCFGGQVSTFVGLDRRVYDSVKILRSYLDQCNAVFLSIGLEGFYPDIFQREPVKDTVKLQTMLFAIQYACAKSWMDCGVQVAALVGHSFGELTALCISGILSLKDTAKMIAARAKLVRDNWGPDSGAMVAIEADLDLLRTILDESRGLENDTQETAGSPVTIACYNGPRSFTLAGSTSAVDKLTETLAKNPTYASATRFKRLNVTNAFHSHFVGPLMVGLAEIGETLTWREPNILLERATEALDMDPLTPGFVAQHMRNPVYFHHAVKRLAQQHPEAVWLEAGSNSTITTMASRALGSPTPSHFQSLNITCDHGLQNLADSTLALWRAGIPCEFWPHHAGQTYEFEHIFLPPYQFDKVKHWMDLKKPQKEAVQVKMANAAATNEIEPEVTTLLSFLGFQDDKQRSARFRVNTGTQIYNDFVSGHWIAQTAPICPATLEVDMVIEALMSVRPDFDSSGMQAIIQNMQNHAPICLDPSRLVYIDYKANDLDGYSWSWKIISVGPNGAKTTTTEHVDGRIVFRPTKDLEYHAEFDRYSRFFGHQRCLDVLDAAEADDIIQGRNIYKTFAEIVDYGEDYRGLKRLVGVGNESAGRIVKTHSGATWLDTHLSDCFSQVGGIWVNCMTNRAPGDMYIASGCQLVMRTPHLRPDSPVPKIWDVLACHHQSSDKAYTTDIFAFDAENGQLREIMLGINYVKVAKASMQKILSRLSPGLSPNAPVARAFSHGNLENNQAKASTTASHNRTPTNALISTPKQTDKPKAAKKVPRRSSVRADMKSMARKLLADISGLEPDEIQDDVELADIGIDSLMGMELAREVETVFKCTLPMEKLMEVTDFPSFVDCVKSVAGPAAGQEQQLEDESDVDDLEDEEVDDDVTDSSKLLETSSENNTNGGASTPASSVGDERPEAKVNIMEYLTDLLGVDEIQDETLLVDLGVDSLLSTELRSDLSSKFELHLSEDVSVEALSVAELDRLINGPSPRGPSSKPAHSQSTAAASTSPPSHPAARATPRPEEPIPSMPAMTSQPRSNGPALVLSSTTVLESFGQSKLRTDGLIREFKIDNFANVIRPKTTQLCIALTLEAFEKLGVSISAAKPGEVIPRVPHASQHRRLVEYLYDMLEKEARLVDTTESGEFIRTFVSPPVKSSTALFQDLVRLYPDWSCAMKLTQFAGSRMADVLTARTDGIKVIFGSDEGRTLVAGLYRDHVFNKMSYHQMAGYVEDLIAKMPVGQGPLKIMEMGAGTGGTTLYMAPLLERLGANVEYTFTDLSPSMVAAAKKTFKRYPFMKFLPHDIENPVPAELLGTQHIVIASNAVHATHDLVKSGIHIRNALRPDGFLMMLEMTEIVPFVDIIFGLLEGWWLFDDGRKHAIIPPGQWETALHSAGFGHVDWSDGHLPENRIQKVIIAMACGPPLDRLPLPDQAPPQPGAGIYPDLATRERDITAYVKRFSSGFTAPVLVGPSDQQQPSRKCVLITGASGSLGTHLVKALSERDDVDRVICVNRRSGASIPMARQIEALALRGVELDDSAKSKLYVIETDSNKPMLGLGKTEYADMARTVTGIIHNAWPMSGNRPIKGFEAQFQTLRNLIDLARYAVEHGNHKVDFQLISSIGVVGHYPLWTGETRVPEERMDVRSVLPNGYCDAKFTCERILDETLHKYPQHFHTMSARLGQIAGSKTSGYWNPMEHFSFLVKSSQTLRALPRLEGSLSWCPVNDMAAALSELLLSPTASGAIYHIDNPIQQPWPEMLEALAAALELDHANAIVPFDEWIDRVRRSPLAPETDNPAARLVDFLDVHFRRMSCGGLVLDTAKACKDSPALAAVGAVDDDTARKYVSAWREMGFLH